ncbi:MAG TPA: RDD family protein [Acidimicrobiales bacterium]
MTATSPDVATDPTAVVGRRLLAAAIDLGILWVFSATFWVLASRQLPTEAQDLGLEPCTGRKLCTTAGDRFVSGWPVVILVLVWVAYLVGVFVLERGLTGRTIGTMLTGLVTVGEDGRPLGVGQALVRSVAGVVDYFPCCLPLVGIATIAATPGHRRVGDIAARSHVVGQEWFGHPIVLNRPEPEAPAPPPSTIPASPPIPAAATPPVTTSPFAPPGAPAAGPTPPATDDGPVWDPERRAYLQWDPARQQWLQYEQATGEWQQYDPGTGRWRPLDR